MSQTNARTQGGGLILPQGASPGSINVGELALILDTDGVVKTQNAAGSKSPVGTGGSSVIATSVSPITISGLVPATDGDYDVFAQLNINQANTALKLQPNGSDTNTFSVTGDLLAGAVRHSTWALGKAAQDPMLIPNASVLMLAGRLFAKAGRSRYADFNWYLFTTAGGLDDTGNWKCYWNDTSTALTSLVMLATAGGFDSASFMRVTSVPNSL